MAYQCILVERAERVGIITLNRPEQYNTFNTALAQDLCKGLLELETDEAVRVVVVKGAGKALTYSNELFAALCVTEDAKEGVDAFLQKRKPDWKGR